MTQTLANGPQAYPHLLGAALKSRSVAAEGGHADLLTDTTVPALGLTVPGLDRILGNDKTVEMLADLVSGDKTCDAVGWMNLVRLVDMSPSWQIHLAARGVQMPTPEENRAQMLADARAAR